MATQYQKRMMMRKNSDITRLAEQFQKDIAKSTGEYESAFASYQKNVAEQMAPYEVASKQYKEIQMPAYEASVADYQRRLEEFKTAISEYESKPKESTGIIGSPTRGGLVFNVDGKSISEQNLPGEYSVELVGKKYVLYKDRPMPKAPGGVPSAPEAPQAPQVAGFDEGQFEQKRAQLQQGFQREIGERRGARLAVVGRKGSRPLMQDQ